MAEARKFAGAKKTVYRKIGTDSPSFKLPIQTGTLHVDFNFSNSQPGRPTGCWLVITRTGSPAHQKGNGCEKAGLS